MDRLIALIIVPRTDQCHRGSRQAGVVTAIVVFGSLMLGWVSPNSAAAGTTVQGEHFKVNCDFNGKTVADAALETAESAWTIVARDYGLGTPHAPEKMLEIYLYRDEANYVAAERERTGGRFRANLSFSCFSDKTSHIVLQPACTKATLKRIGIPSLTRMLVAHEATHLAVYALLPSFESHPEWLSEGLATSVAVEVVHRSGQLRSRKSDPFTSTMMRSVQQLAESEQLPTIEAILSGGCKGLNLYPRYAVYWQFFEFLKANPRQKQYEAVLAETRRLGGGPDFEGRLHDTVKKTLGGMKGLETLDKQFKEWIAGARPVWFEQFRSLDAPADRWVQIAFPRQSAYGWRLKPNHRSSFVIEGSLELLPSIKGGSESFLMLGDDAGTSVRVCFAEGDGVLVRRGTSDEPDAVLAEKPCAAVVVGTSLDFKVALRKKQLIVNVNGRPVLTCEPGESLRAWRWGVGARAGSAGIWRGVKLRSRKEH